MQELDGEGQSYPQQQVEQRTSEAGTKASPRGATPVYIQVSSIYISTIYPIYLGM